MIKRMLILTLISVFSFVLPVGVVGAQSPNSFTIESFEADYFINKTDKNVSTMRVEEKLVAVFPDYDQNHGILRSIPKQYKGHSLKLDILSVTDESGRPYEYSSSGQNDNEVLKIGDPSTYAHGRTTYKITYTLKEVISFENSHDEFYWDINGDEWPQVFGSVTARVHVPASLADGLQERSLCFTGRFGQSDSNCVTSKSSNANETVIETTTTRLSGYETLTVVLAFNKGTFEADKIAALLAIIFLIFLVCLVVVPPLLAFVIVYRKWRRHGKDPEGRGVIIPEYLPPKSLNPILSDMILTEKLSNKAISATVIEMATQKYLTIYELDQKSRDYELELIKQYPDISSEYYKVLEMFFGSSMKVGDKVKLSSLKNTLYKDLTKLGGQASTKVFELGYFANDPAKARNRFMGAGAGLLIAGFIVMFTGVGLLLGIGLILASVITFVGTNAMPARTIEGVDMRDYLKGMGMYIKLAEVERIKYLQSPEGAKRFGDPAQQKTKIKLFEKLLPYAMLLGLEKKWAEEFRDLYTQPPDWYHGNWSTFNTAHLASSLGSFSSANSTTFAAPSSSSSSGFSGGGGGFSGGGGGGGGGGGW